MFYTQCVPQLWNIFKALLFLVAELYDSHIQIKLIWVLQSNESLRRYTINLNNIQSTANVVN